MALLQFFQLTALPGTLEPKAFYFIENGEFAESYLTDAAGVAKMIGNSAMINQLIAAMVSGTNIFQVVDDIAERDGAVQTANALVLVRDATGDPTVTSGAALYVYDDSLSTYSKIAEYESLDVVLSWANIINKPTSTAGAIDAAVAASHSHTNMSALNKISDIGGFFAYDSTLVGSWAVTNW